MKKYLVIAGVAAVAWYVWKNYIQHNTAVQPNFPTVGMGGANTYGTQSFPTQN
jgi:hypothetical protein